MRRLTITAAAAALMVMVMLPSGAASALAGNPARPRTHTQTQRPAATGTGWVIQPTPNQPGSKSNVLAGVACPAVNLCVAAGFARRSPKSAGGRILAERWNGSAWRIVHTPVPAATTASGFTSVSCSSRRACTAVGSYAAAAGIDRPLAERWNGTAWRIERIPAPAGAQFGTDLFAVSCPAPVACMAVGLARLSKAKGSALVAERWNGIRWSITPAPVPARARFSELRGVSCSSARRCTAVGDDQDAAGGFTLAERWNGISWMIQHTPSPSGGLGDDLLAVSCPTATACTAVGSRATGPELLAERWNGRRWAVQRTPPPARAANAELNAVSCASASRCTAAGDYLTSPVGTEVTLADSWRQNRWSRQRTPKPRGAVFSSLLGIWCPSAARCTAVGFAVAGATTRTLAEARSR